MTDPRSAPRVWAALLIVYLVWGSTYLAIRVVVQGGLPPLLTMGLRFLLAAPLLAAFVALRGGLGRLRITRRELLASAAVGTLLVAMGNGMVAVAEQTVPSGLAALLIASVPLLLVVLRLTRRDMPRPLVWLGVIVGFIGVAFLGLQGGGMAEVERWGVLLTPRPAGGSARSTHGLGECRPIRWWQRCMRWRWAESSPSRWGWREGKAYRYRSGYYRHQPGLRSAISSSSDR
jgi:hypothetical protein